MTTNQKAQLGQFMTKNCEYILQGMTLPDFKGTFVEPFVGEGDLVEFMLKRDVSLTQIECYDIDPKPVSFAIQQRDTLLNPLCYIDHYVITNPPYLARNKSVDKTVFDQYGLNDLYKCFLKQLIHTPPVGGILIIPLNFWSSIRSMDVNLRKEFLEVFNIQRLNIFETTVFQDTSYTICAVQFEKAEHSGLEQEVSAWFLPTGECLHFTLHEKNQYTFGGEIYALPVCPHTQIRRLTRLNSDQDSEYITGIIAKCIDDDSSKPIQLFYTENQEDIRKYTDCTRDLTFRSYAVLVIEPKLTVAQQQRLVEQFNTFLQEKRQSTRSLFLTNYRDHYRKRISFDLVYRIVGYLLK